MGPKVAHIVCMILHISYSTNGDEEDGFDFMEAKRLFGGFSDINRNEYECKENTISDLIKYVHQGKELSKASFTKNPVAVVMGTGDSGKTGLANRYGGFDELEEVNPERDINIYPRIVSKTSNIVFIEAANLKSTSVAGQATGAYFLNKLIKESSEVGLVFAYKRESQEVFEYMKRIDEKNPKIGWSRLYFNSFFVSTSQYGQINRDDVADYYRRRSKKSSKGRYLPGIKENIVNGQRISSLKFPMYGSYESCIEDGLDQVINDTLKNSTISLMNHFKKISKNKSVSRPIKMEIFNNALQNVTFILNQVNGKMKTGDLTKTLAAYLKLFDLNEDAKNIIQITDNVDILSTLNPGVWQNTAFLKGLEPLREYLTRESQEMQSQAALADLTRFSCDDPQHQELINEKLYEIKFALSAHANAKQEFWTRLLSELGGLTGDNVEDLYEKMDKKGRKNFLIQLFDALKKYDDSQCSGKRGLREPVEEPSECVEENVNKTMKLFKGDGKNVVLRRDEYVVVVLGSETSGQQQVANVLANFEIGSDSSVNNLAFPEYLSSPINDTYSDYAGPQFKKDKSPPEAIMANYYLHRLLSDNEAKIIITVSEDSLSEKTSGEDLKFTLEEAIKVLVGFSNFSKCFGFVISNVKEDNIEDGGTKAYAKLITALEKLSSGSDEKIKAILKVILDQKEELKKKTGILFKSTKFVDDDAFKSNRNQILKIVENNLLFDEYSRENMNIMHNEEKKLAHCVEWNIRKNMVEDIKNLLQPLEHFLTSLEEGKYLDYNARYKEFDYVTKVILGLLKKLTISENIKTPFDPLINLMVGLRLHFPEDTIDQIVKGAMFIRSNGHSFTDVIKEGFEPVKNRVLDSRRWYYFLRELEYSLSDYDVVKDGEKYESDAQKLLGKIRTGSAVKEDVLNFIKKIKEIPAEAFEELLGNITLELRKFHYLGEIVDRLFTKQLHVDCSDEVNVCRGSHVKVSACLEHRCLPKKPIEILATHIVYIDSDIIEIGNENYVAIMAPKWQVIGDRLIDLNGKDGVLNIAPKATGVNKTVPGNKGKPGLPGGPAGHFLGIGNKFSHQGRISVSAVGGKGSSGQAGGDGGPAKDPKDPPLPWDVKKQVVFEDYGFRSQKRPDGCFSYRICTFTLVRDSGDGAPGGDGGVGGEGGIAGEIRMLSLRGKHFHVRQTIGTGADGDGGQGGSPGFKKTGTFTVTVERVPWLFSSDTFRYSINDKARPTTVLDVDPGRTIVLTSRGGKRGKANQYTYARKKAKPLNNQPTFALAINRYKVFLRESSPKSSTAVRILREIDTNLKVNQMYNVASLADNYYQLEKQSQKLKKKTSVVPFYETLFQQMTNFSEMTKINEEEKKVLVYLCTAIVSKLAAINKETSLVVDITLYLKNIMESIKDLHGLKNDKLVYSYKNDYQKKIDSAIKEATQLVEKDMKPMVENLKVKMDRQIDDLINEVIEKKKQIKNQKKDLQQNKSDLEKSLIWRKVLGVVGVVTSILGFLGPVAGAVGGALNAAIYHPLLHSDTAKAAATALINIPAGINAQLSTLTSALEGKKSTFRDHLEVVDKKLAEMKGQGVDKEVNAIQTKVKKTRAELSRVDTENLDPNSVREISRLRSSLNKEIEEKKSDMKKLAKYDARIEKQVMTIARLQIGTNIGQAVAQGYAATKSGNDIIDQVKEQLKKNEETMKKLEAYENNIYYKMLPLVHNIKNTIDGLSENKAGMSHASLDVEQWKVTEHLLDMKDAMRKMTQGFKMSEEMQNVMNKIERGIVVMMKLYHRIQDSKDKSELATFLADINSNKATEIQVKDPLLNKLTIDAQISIKTNLILDAYERAVGPFLQAFFPFGMKLYGTFDLPSNLMVGNSTERLVMFAEKRIIDMTNKIIAQKTTITNQDQYIFNNSPFKIGGDELFPPYYTWKYENNKDAIASLLNGNTVELNADIYQLQDIVANRIAVKFNTLRLALVPRDPEKIKTIANALYNFYIALTSLGTFYYKCQDKVFDITNDPFTIRYSHRTDGEHPASYTDVYRKIKENTAMFSPYGKWNVTLEHPKVKELLKPMHQMEIDLQLHGTGFFVSEKSDICKENLDLLYRRDGINPTRFPANIDFLNQLREH